MQVITRTQMETTVQTGTSAHAARTRPGADTVLALLRSLPVWRVSGPSQRGVLVWSVAHSRFPGSPGTTQKQVSAAETWSVISSALRLQAETGLGCFSL